MPARTLVVDDDPLAGELIGEIGALVQSGRAYPLGTRVTVSLELEAGTPALRSGALVVRTVGMDRMGIQFENLGPAESIRLQEYLLPLILAAT